MAIIFPLTHNTHAIVFNSVKWKKSSLYDLHPYVIARDGNDSQTNQNVGHSEDYLALVITYDCIDEQYAAYRPAEGVYSAIVDDTQTPYEGQDN
ncbi:hypothetical protein RRG08_020181 [Elysia crispata]|uniref:Uncharacterized protein n=1 Tax=Elysia crispata TaxID=231223 RepID=A0AAE0YP11_9GAST|nr:hypothetical protein RRG08_020181 [Elysia crispata]